MVLKRIYKVKKNLYIYSAKKFIPYPMWDMTKVFNVIYVKTSFNHKTRFKTMRTP